MLHGKAQTCPELEGRFSNCEASVDRSDPYLPVSNPTYDPNARHVEVHMNISSLGNALILFQPLHRMDVVLLGYHSKYFNI